MKKNGLITKCLFYKCTLLSCLTVLSGVGIAQAETHSNLQSVNETGASAWIESFPFTIRGVITTTLDEVLDPTPNFLPWDNGANSGKMGAEWQIFIQAVGEGDFGGTALWLGQNYGNQPWIRNEDMSYSNEDWLENLLRVTIDPESGVAFAPGDLVEVTARKSLAYGGKRNINEAHSKALENKFDIRLLEADYGLPAPELITLGELVLPDYSGENAQLNIFDQTRQTGGEHYQGTRVRINGIQIVSAEGWNPEETWPNRGNIKVTDGNNRFFALRHPRRNIGPVPTGAFDAIGIINQESGSATLGSTGYELFIQEVVDESPAPQLYIDASNAMILWAAENSYWVLESASTPDGSWSAVEVMPIFEEGTYKVKIEFSQKQSFYRLRKNK
ncbi:MAG: hypothetical protein EOM12_02425 [Verrucomicrobiae bacterium]|nr:hypothetical protein [Verrucomicrobiae bacterium]